MYSNNYSKEIGMVADEKIVPLKFALPALALILGGVGFGFLTSLATVRTAKHTHRTPAALLAPGHTLASR